MLPRLLRNILGRYPTGPRAPSRRTPLRLEPLEAREVPATVYGLGAVNTLVRFDSAAPNAPATTYNVGVTGVGPGEVLVGLDFRPNFDGLYGYSVTAGSGANSAVKLYQIDPLTGAATFLSLQTTLPGAGDLPAGFSFDPIDSFRIRYVNANDENARFSGGVFVDDPNLNPSGAQVTAAAYAFDFPRIASGPPVPATLYGISRATSTLVTIGGVNGLAPSGPNGGAVAAVGPLGVTLDAGSDAGFDILKSPENGGRGTALAALTVGGVTGLYSVNLSTGAATLIGPVGNGATRLRGIAAVPDSALVVGSGPGATGDVRILDPDASVIRQAIVPFAGFKGGVKVAAGDVNGDGTPDAIVSADAPQGHVKVFDGKTGAELDSFFAFAGFQGTVNVAAGDVNGDGFADVVVVANGAGGHVKAFSGKDGSLLASFLAYPGFAGVTTVAAADFDNDGRAEIVTAAASSGHVKVSRADGSLFTVNLPPTITVGFFSPGGPTPVSFLAYQGFTGTVNVAADPATGTGIVVSTGAGTRGHVKIFGGPSFMSQVASFFAFPAGFTGGAFVALADANSDGIPDIRATPGFGAPANVLTFNSSGLQFAPVFPAFAGFIGGATLAGARF
jgi:hypothetical protein